MQHVTRQDIERVFSNRVIPDHLKEVWAFIMKTFFSWCSEDMQYDANLPPGRFKTLINLYLGVTAEIVENDRKNLEVVRKYGHRYRAAPSEITKESLQKFHKKRRRTDGKIARKKSEGSWTQRMIRKKGCIKFHIQEMDRPLTIMNATPKIRA